MAHNGDLTIALLAQHRGCGVGSRLLDAVLEHARGLGVEMVRLQVFASNSAAIRLYASRGFREDGVVRRAVRLPERDEDYVLMSLELSAAEAPRR